MKNRPAPRLILLFLLFFLLRWGGQMAAGQTAQLGNNNPDKILFLALMYACFLSRGFLWLYILRDMTLTKAYALSSLGYLVVPLLSVVILGESFDPVTLPAGLLILAGVVLYGKGEEAARG